MCEYIIAEDFHMGKYIFAKSNGLWYDRQGDYYRAIVKGKFEIFN